MVDARLLAIGVNEREGRAGDLFFRRCPDAADNTLGQSRLAGAQVARQQDQ